MRIAVVGAGPSGFYAVQALFRRVDDIRVDVFDRLPTPYGLVRGGVAPDHQKIKKVVRAYDRIADDPRFRFFGNVKVGVDLRVPDLLERYDQVILAVGALDARRLGIPGEELPGSFSATEFVAWYNGHPDFQDRDFPLATTRSVAVVGMGNVAMDVTRILVSAAERLATTDITHDALDALARRQREKVHVLARRGPAQAACAPKEAMEIAVLDGVTVRTRDEEATLDPLSARWLEVEGDRCHIENARFAREHADLEIPEGSREVWMRFRVSPVEILGAGRVEGIRVERTQIVESGGRLRPTGTGQFEDIPCEMVLTAVGYRSARMPDVPYDELQGLIPNDVGQVVDGEVPVDDLYVVGWAKRGCTGLIGTNKADAVEAVERMLATGVKRSARGDDPGMWVHGQVPSHVGWDGWKALDAHEVEAGSEKGKVREKLTDVEAMVRAIRSDEPA